jgi:hypothetical protein
MVERSAGDQAQLGPCDPLPEDDLLRELHGLEFRLCVQVEDLQVVAGGPAGVGGLQGDDLAVWIHQR